MNNDTTRNYFMINLKLLIYKHNETQKIVDFSTMEYLLTHISVDNEKYQETVDPFVTEYLELKNSVIDYNNLYEEII